MGNQFQLFAGLVRAAAARCAHAPPKAEFDRLAAQLEAMIALHACLAHRASQGDVDLGGYLDRLCLALRVGLAHPHGVALSLARDGATVTLAPEAAQTAGMIVAELVTNAVKHAFEGCPRPEVQVSCLGETVVKIAVLDNGCGLGPASPDRDGHLGTTLTARLARRLGGGLVLGCGPDGGTRAALTFSARP